jgi:hypothetical protein
MNSRERVIRTLKFDAVDRIPRQLWQLPGIPLYRKADLAEIAEKYPDDLQFINYGYGMGSLSRGQPGVVGQYTDAWGCTFTVAEPGVIGEVKDFVLDDWRKLDSYQLPWAVIERIDADAVNRFCAASDRFVIAATETRPFERVQFLRGTENTFLDLAYGTKQLDRLLHRLHDFFIKEISAWAATDVDGIWFLDDWGTQVSLLISPVLWREVFKPLYRDYVDIIHAHGKYAFYHSDGNIEAIYPDLVEIGVDAVNTQLFCMDIEGLGEKFAGKIAFWGEIDRQHVLPFGTPDEVKAAVNRVAAAMIRGKKTGVIAECEFGMIEPKENIMAVFEAWNQV